jgi:ACS family tartrate transporter-like MFS transporter
MQTAVESACSKVTWRLVPFLMLLYVVSWLDRVNVGFAALQMNRDLGFSPAVFGFGAGVFFIGYALFEVPSNLVLARVGARRWIARIMVTWGLVSTAMMFVQGPTSFYVLRFVLGVAEAGFLPGVIYYLAQWYPRAQRARAVSWFMIGIPLSTVLGAPLAGALLQMNGLQGLAGWQWLYLLEGLPAVVLGFVVWRVLPDTPRQARWLAPAEQEALIAHIAAENAAVAGQRNLPVWRVLSHPTVWLLGFSLFACQCGSYGLTLWIPQILKGLSGQSDLMVGLLSAVPYMAAAVGMVVLGISSDRTGERFWHVAGPSFLGAAGFAASAWFTSPVPGMLALTVAAVGDLSSRGPFWALPPRFLSGSALAAGIALINTLGAVGGFVGPYAVGLVKNATGSFSGGLLLLSGLLVTSAITTLWLRRSTALAAHAA